jgi:citrate lyase subunit beta/citryl-CoA lyase
VLPTTESAGAVTATLERRRQPVDLVALVETAAGLAYPRAQLVIASRAAGIAAPIDSPTLDDHDLEDDTARSRASGMTGMLCIRSDQVGLVNSGFISSAGEDQWAQDIIDRLGEDGAGVQVSSDRPLLHRALWIRHQVQQYARGA